MIFCLQPNFFGLEFFDDNTTQSKHVANGNLSFGEISNMKMVKLIMLHFRNEHLPGWTAESVKAYEMRIVRHMEKSVTVRE